MGELTNESISSTLIDSYENMETVNVRNYVKDLLRSRIFLGRYLERRLIDRHIGYRDVVIISPAEIELKKDLMDAQHKLQTLYTTQWIGISEAETIDYSSGTCIFTEIDNQPFGPFWFQIKSIKYRDSEVIIMLKCLRHISDSFLEVEPVLTGTVDKFKGKKESILPNVETKLNDIYSDVTVTLKNALTVNNIKEFITFLFAFVIAIFTGSTAFINFLGNFVLALLREMSILVKNSTPIFLGFLDFISKIVGGFYILVAMFFKPNSPSPLYKRSIAYQNRHKQDSRNYNSRDFD